MKTKAILIIMISGLALLIAIMGTNINYVYSYVISRNWPIYPATIIKSIECGDEFRIYHVVWKYSVNSQTYTGEDYRYDGDNYKVGQMIELKVDPDNGRQSEMKARDDFRFMLSIVFGFLPVGFIAYIMLLGIAKRFLKVYNNIKVTK